MRRTLLLWRAMTLLALLLAVWSILPTPAWFTTVHASSIIISQETTPRSSLRIEPDKIEFYWDDDEADYHGIPITIRVHQSYPMLHMSHPRYESRIKLEVIDTTQYSGLLSDMKQYAVPGHKVERSQPRLLLTDSGWTAVLYPWDGCHAQPYPPSKAQLERQHSERDTPETSTGGFLCGIRAGRR